jgi:uncharacterized protein YecE (DUF72 family)
MTRVGVVRIGCSGWSYDSWRGRLYPERLPRSRWLEHYAASFDTVEVNASFYRLPTTTAVRSWVAQVPPGFVFAVKVSRYLTHVRRLREIADGWALLRERLDPLAQANLLGPILWQLPANFPREDERLQALFDIARSEQHAIEFRHASWLNPEVAEQLRRHHIALAIGDDPRRPLPMCEPAGPIAYLRLHFGHRGRRGRYSDGELDRWADLIARWRTRADVFVFFNNDWEGFAVDNASALIARCARQDACQTSRSRSEKA